MNGALIGVGGDSSSNHVAAASPPGSLLATVVTIAPSAVGTVDAADGAAPGETPTQTD